MATTLRPNEIRLADVVEAGTWRGIAGHVPGARDFGMRPDAAATLGDVDLPNATPFNRQKICALVDVLQQIAAGEGPRLPSTLLDAGISKVLRTTGVYFDPTAAQGSWIERALARLAGV